MLLIYAGIQGNFASCVHSQFLTLQTHPNVLFNYIIHITFKYVELALGQPVLILVCILSNHFH